MARSVFGDGGKGVVAEADARLAGVDEELARRFPGEPAGRQPVHTVYVPGDAFGPGTVREWGERALAALEEHAPDAAALAAAVGAPVDDALYARVREKLRREPVEDLRVDFEDGYGVRDDAEEDAAAAAAARTLAAMAREGAQAGPGAPPYFGIRIKCLEAAVRARGIRTLDVFLAELLDAAGGVLPAGLLLTLPKVTYPQQVSAMARLCTRIEESAGLPTGRLGFEIQIETTQSILGPDGRATVALMIDAAEGRCTSLHYGTFDYSAACGISAAHQALDHPAADHAKAVMQTAAAGTGVRLSDGSTNVVPVGGTEQVRSAWRLHHSLVRRSLARAYYQGWDMHPGHLPTRYAAVYAFYRAGLGDASARLAAYLDALDAARLGASASAGTGTGPGAGAGAGEPAVLDEPATARALAGYLLRGLDCGAWAPEELAAQGARPAPSRARLEELAGRSKQG
ncbi:DUF6986 family protein [Phaeacidiphilus oryzae]|uniref:DUF6986 family protein n=1 Tax=Phaeacidiphilus oryzae TaxID=348818 RepID=UPI00068C69FF|nr:hypothetical protein [Phaeacidiphilus oryzae]